MKKFRLDPVYLHNRNEYFAIEPYTTGEYYHQIENTVSHGTFDARWCMHFTEGFFTVTETLTFPNVMQAQEYVNNIVNN